METSMRELYLRARSEVRTNGFIGAATTRALEAAYVDVGALEARLIEEVK
jgi:hypothetical protein